MPATVSALFVGCPSPLVERIGSCLDDAGILLDSRETGSETELNQQLLRGADLVMVDTEASGISEARVMDLKRESQSQATIIFLVTPRGDKPAAKSGGHDLCDVIPQNDLHQLVRTVRRAMVEKMVRPEAPAKPKAPDAALEKELNGLLHLIQDDAQQLLSLEPRDASTLNRAHQLKVAAENTVRLVQTLLDLGQTQKVEAIAARRSR